MFTYFKSGLEVFLLKSFLILSSKGSFDNLLNGDGILWLDADDNSAEVSATGLVSLKHKREHSVFYTLHILKLFWRKVYFIMIWASAWDFQQCGMCDQHSLRSACAYMQSDQSLCSSLEYSMSVKLLTEHLLEVLSLKGGCTGSSESTLVKMSNCWKSHVTAHMYFKVSWDLSISQW